MTINFYRNEFSVILGHNGAGKSCLMKIIVGMYKPTSGYVYVDKVSGQRKESTIESIGYCPQENILVNYMTTLQHIYMFGMMRGMTYKSAYTEALLLLKQLNLESVKDLRVTTCTFDVQRRVCLAMALIGNSEILVLDEPARGTDSEHKKQIWDLLSSIKRRKTILMVTNSMDAADILADRIAIIADRRIECYGSKMYLNLRYGIGHILSILVNDNCNLEKLRLEIQQFSSEPITLRGTMGMMARFDVPRNSRFTKLLQHLELNKQRLHIISMTLNAASIEGQFLRIGLTRKFKDLNMFYPSKKIEYLIQQRRRHILQSGRKWKRLSQSALRNQQIYAMFHKKLLHILSAWRLYTFSISLAIITLVLTMMLSGLSNFSLFKDAEIVMNLTNYVDNNLHVLYYAVNEKPAKDFLVYLYTTGQSYSDRHNYHISKNISATDLLIHPNLHSIEFRDRYFMSIDVLTDSHIDLAYSSTAVHSGPIALNLLHNALLRYHTGSDDYSIKLTSRPLMNPKQWQHLLIHPRSVRNWENAAITVTLFLLLPTIDLGIKELTTFSKTLQINTFGVTTLMYWLPMYITDLCIYSLCIQFLTMIILFGYHGVMQISALEMVQMHAIFLSYGACAIPLGYCTQLLTNKAGYVYLTVILMNFFVVLVVNGSIVFPLVIRTVGRRGRILFEMLLHAFPPYVLACTLSNYIMLNLHNRQCSYFNTCDTEFHVQDPCCQNDDENNVYKPLDIMLTKQSGAEYHHSVTDDILLMISQILFFHLVLHIFDENNRKKWYNYSLTTDKKEHALQPEVTAKKEHVKFMEQYGNTKLLSSKVALVVQNLRKEHNGKVILDDVNFCIHHQECFGLLGLNGAGKSTIFRILSNETRMTSGKVVMFDHEFTKNKAMFLGMIGYCPQTGGLVDYMTGRQCLQLYAALRGIPQEEITDEVDKWLDVLELLDFENVKIENCPWGIQRKICVLQSLIGDLPMVLMDEPSSGIDVMTRHAIGDTLHQVQEMGRTLLITTHNMWEAEALCLRVGVLVNGQFVAINFCEELKEKHGRNFILSIRLTPMIPIDNLNTIKNSITETFPGIHFKDYHLGILKYEFHSDIPYSNIFDKLEKLRYKYIWMSDFSVNQPSMEEAFLELVKDQKQDPVKSSLYEKCWSWLNRTIR